MTTITATTARPVFNGFEPPKQRISLELGAFSTEIWPELGGAVASFEHRLNGGAPKQVFRRTPEKARYEPYDLACWPLVPYPNRIKDGRFQFGGRHYQLPLNYEGVTHPLVLTAQGLEIELTLTNDGKDPMPYGLGQHPYIERPHGTRVQAQVDGVWLTDEHLVPTSHSVLPPRHRELAEHGISGRLQRAERALRLHRVGLAHDRCDQFRRGWPCRHGSGGSGT